MIRPSEVQILLLALSLSPLIIGMYRATHWHGKPWLGAGLLSMLVAYVSTVVEGFVAESFFNGLEHTAYAVGAICFAVATTALLRVSESTEETG